MKPLKVFSVIRTYSQNRVLNIVVAVDEAGVYDVLSWSKKDRPTLDIRELPRDKPASVFAEHLFLKELVNN